MDFPSSALIRLTPDYSFKSFDCENKDLNDFFLNDAKPYLAEFLAVTFILEDRETNSTIAFFSLLNDKVSITDVSGNNVWNRIRKRMPQSKKFKSYPAMKIGRLGISKEYKGKGYGTAILDYLKILFITENRTGCKFITVDAYKDSLPFYEKNGFSYFTENDKDKNTRAMYFDLKNIY